MLRDSWQSLRFTVCSMLFALKKKDKMEFLTKYLSDSTTCKMNYADLSYGEEVEK